MAESLSDQEILKYYLQETNRFNLLLKILTNEKSNLAKLQYQRQRKLKIIQRTILLLLAECIDKEDNQIRLSLLECSQTMFDNEANCKRSSSSTESEHYSSLEESSNDESTGNSLAKRRKKSPPSVAEQLASLKEKLKNERLGNKALSDRLIELEETRNSILERSLESTVEYQNAMMKRFNSTSTDSEEINDIS